MAEGNRGSRNGNAKLSEDQARAIRASYIPFENATTLAELYGINRRSVRSIALGETWGWLD